MEIIQIFNWYCFSLMNRSTLCLFCFLSIFKSRNWAIATNQKPPIRCISNEKVQISLLISMFYICTNIICTINKNAFLGKQKHINGFLKQKTTMPIIIIECLVSFYKYILWFMIYFPIGIKRLMEKLWTYYWKYFQNSKKLS